MRTGQPGVFLHFDLDVVLRGLQSMNKPLRMRLLPLIIGSVLAASTAFAQNTSSSLSGRIVDAAGQPVAGATVQILHVPSGTTKTVTTDANGHYSAQGLRVGGPFFVTADKAGETAERNDVYLKLAEETTLNLVAGSTATTTLEGITVTASALTQVFQPDNKGLSTNVSGRELQNAPSANRAIQDIARLDPRIVVTDLRDDVFYAQLHLESGGTPLTIDARPSDAIALALRARVPILVEDRVFEKAERIAPPRGASPPTL